MIPCVILFILTGPTCEEWPEDGQMQAKPIQCVMLFHWAPVTEAHPIHVWLPMQKDQGLPDHMGQQAFGMESGAWTCVVLI